MKKYILKRVGISIVTVFVLVSVVFFLARLMPGSRSMIRKCQQPQRPI